MGWYKGLSRREFVRMAATAVVASGAASCSRVKAPWRFLTIEEARTLATFCEQLIPTDETPGAAWAGVVNYIDTQLCGPYQHLREAYRGGVADLERACRQLYGKRFAEIADEQQLVLLRAPEKGEVAQRDWPTAAQKSFFEMVRTHTMQGFYGDPRHGGNRDRVSWKMVGLNYPPVRGQQRY